MTNITFSVDKKLHARMRAHPEIKWTEILRHAIRDFLTRLEEPQQMRMQEIRDKLSPDALEYLAHLDLVREAKFTSQAQKMEEDRLKRLEELPKQADE